jgi:hypothetical protein
MARSTILQRMEKVRDLKVKRPTAAYQWEINRIIELATNDLLELAASGHFYRDSNSNLGPEPRNGDGNRREVG